jgi:triacylglycerol esterase/lipase EstA (alpha/beta hydrolase family)
MLSVSYNSSAAQSNGQISMYILGEYLVNNIIRQDDNISQGSRPVFLVGHSLGGLVIKQFIHTASSMRTRNDSDKVQYLLANWKGVIFYATPHAGSRLADSARCLPFP